MKVYEFGREHANVFAMFQCAVEPWWVFRASAEEMAKAYHVYLFIADGHDELGTEFVSLEKYASICCKRTGRSRQRRQIGSFTGSVCRSICCS